VSTSNFPLLFGRIRKALRAEFEERAAALDITAAQFQVLKRLWQSDGLVTSVLAKDICATNSTLTGVLDRMESKKLIRRSPCAHDRRAVEIWLMAGGRALEKPLMKVIQEMSEKALEGFSTSQRQSFLRMLEKVGDNLEA
jgi:DNA-binding MarR family transcriptional regulator